MFRYRPQTCSGKSNYPGGHATTFALLLLSPPPPLFWFCLQILKLKSVTQLIVVLLPRRRITQGRVRFVHQLELFRSGAWTAGVLVRVELQRQFVVRFLDLHLRGPCVEPEDLVKSQHQHQHQQQWKSKSPAARKRSFCFFESFIISRQSWVEQCKSQSAQ